MTKRSRIIRLAVVCLVLGDAPGAGSPVFRQGHILDTNDKSCYNVYKYSIKIV